MTPNHWREIEACYHAALECPDPSARTEYLARLAPEVRKEVEELLAQDSAESPLDHRSGLFEALTPGAMLGHYRVEQSIGAGGMGEVYRATDTKLRRSVAIKVCGAGFVRRFEREARAIAALNHPNICTLYESGPDYLVMELVEGPTLADRIRKGAIPVKEAVDIARQIAEALEAAHEHGIIHRDLKPANIKLTADGRVKVLDFGLAKSTAPTPPDAAAATITETEQGLIVGTPSYMSPEQAEGLPTDKRADIWSFGVVFWEMLTGHRLFDAQSASRILSEVLQREIDFDKLPAGVPQHIRTLLRRCLDRNLKTRLRDIGEARITLLQPSAEPALQRKRVNLAKLGWWIAAAVSAAFVFYASRTPLATQHRQRTKFQITAPEPGLRDIGISPDGRTLLFLGGSTASTRKIWLRSIDGLDTRLAVTVPGLSWYNWSPDSEFICYQAGSRLYRLPRSTAEPPTLIGEAPASITEGIWTNHGALILASQEGIFRLQIPNGGLTKLYEQGGIGLTDLTSDRFAFTRSDGAYAGWIDGRKELRISNRFVHTQQYIPSELGTPGRGGLMLTSVSGLVQVQRFDAAKLQFQGSPVTLFEQDPAFAASWTGTLISSYQSNPCRLAWIDRSGKLIRRVSPVLSLAHKLFRMSPDETHVLLTVRDTAVGHSGMWIADLRNENLARLYFDGAGNGVWSPDGRNVLLATPTGEQRLLPADGSGPGVPWTELKAIPTDWSSDGKVVLYAASNGKGAFELWTTSIDENANRKPTLYRRDGAATLAAGKFSPNGRWITYVSRTEIPQVLVESFPSGKGRWQVTTEGGGMPNWSRDGRELFFIHGTGLWAMPVKPLRESLEFGKAVRLFDLGPGQGYQVSRDGQRFLVLEQEEPMKQVITVDTDWQAGLLPQ